MSEHRLIISLGDAAELALSQIKVRLYHYLHAPVDPRARPMSYIIRHNGDALGVIMLGIPHATRCKKWWGYPGLPTQWQVIDLCRIWIDPLLQRGGDLCHPGIVPGFMDRHSIFRPTVASWAIHEVLQRVQVDRVAMWPPVYPAEPYHILLAISYHDPQYHRGTIYRESRATPMYVDRAGQPMPGSSGKYGWCWRLTQPPWTWHDLTNIKPRSMRLF